MNSIHLLMELHGQAGVGDVLRACARHVVPGSAAGLAGRLLLAGVAAGLLWMLTSWTAASAVREARFCVRRVRRRLTREGRVARRARGA